LDRILKGGIKSPPTELGKKKRMLSQDSCLKTPNLLHRSSVRTRPGANAMSNKRNVASYLEEELVEKSRHLGFNLSKMFENHLKDLINKFLPVNSLKNFNSAGRNWRWWAGPDSNRRPSARQADVLTELDYRPTGLVYFRFRYIATSSLLLWRPYSNPALRIAILPAVSTLSLFRIPFSQAETRRIPSSPKTLV
jgi:hypothetical protein